MSFQKEKQKMYSLVKRKQIEHKHFLKTFYPNAKKDNEKPKIL